MLPRLLQHLAFLGFDAAHLLVVAGYALFERFLFLTDSLAFVLPVAFVAGYVLQLAVIVYMLLAHHLGGVPDDGFAESGLSCYLDSERAARLSDRELEERFHRAAVVEHCPVNDAERDLRKMLEVGIMGSDESEDASLHQFV